MKLKYETNILEFFRAVAQCSDNVYFESTLGDHINLKSTLSQYIFAIVETQPKILSSGRIYCDNPDDMILLKEFIVEE